MRGKKYGNFSVHYRIEVNKVWKKAWKDHRWWWLIKNFTSPIAFLLLQKENKIELFFCSIEWNVNSPLHLLNLTFNRLKSMSNLIPCKLYIICHAKEKQQKKKNEQKKHPVSILFICASSKLNTCWSLNCENIEFNIDVTHKNSQAPRAHTKTTSQNYW